MFYGTGFFRSWLLHPVAFQRAHDYTSRGFSFDTAAEDVDARTDLTHNAPVVCCTSESANSLIPRGIAWNLY